MATNDVREPEVDPDSGVTSQINLDHNADSSDETGVTGGGGKSSSGSENESSNLDTSRNGSVNVDQSVSNTDIRVAITDDNNSANSSTVESTR